MKIRRMLVLLMTVFVSLSPGSVVYAADSSKEIQGELMCQCGCTMVVDVCDCETANQIRAKIAELLDQGQNKDQIVAYFVTQYGEKMLSSPAKKGFNLVAWILPFVAVLASGTALFFILKAWARKGKEAAGDNFTLSKLESPQESEEYHERLQAELKKFKEEGSA